MSGLSLGPAMTGCEAADGLIRRARRSFDDIVAAKERAQADVEAIANEMSTMVAAKGGVWQLPYTQGEIMVNAGGVVFPVSRRALLMPFMKHRYISVLLMHHAGGLPKDPDGHLYLETSSAYFEAFWDELMLYQTGRTDIVTLPASKASDPLYNDYHALFMSEISCYSASQPPAATAAPMEVDGHTPDTQPADTLDEMRQHIHECEEALHAHGAAMVGLRAVRDDIRRFLTAMEPFFASRDADDNAVLSLTIHSRTVSIMRKTLERLGHNHPLLTRFSTTPPCWADRSVRQTPTKCFMAAVEFARRIAMAAAGRLIRPPLVEEADNRHFVEDIEMYALKYEPLCNGVTSGDFVIETAEESSRDTFEYPSFLNKVVGKSGLLFALQDGDTHRFGAFIDGPLTPPANPTQINCDKVPVFFFSLSGAYETPTKIELPENEQQVDVAGTEGVEKNMDERTAKVGIGGGAAALWLTIALPGPAADLSSCELWIKRDKLPDGYIDDSDFDDEEENGPMDEEGDGTLAHAEDFTCTELEVWHVTEEVNA
ncbi:unnamed protein product [Vitrella brassicaformis CCMP3155]|uniref:TLDc domain-containing protein n=1 Tax=Vitrella brassicaformis (strain CCMP3155) TaxID=1169540 RepID=A0A0G4FQP8_VITBC|nr:unnamed protein product [Vitrella brassicaformis CCMP3155]|eukprot:CEM16781.1 unnamed protein product [Vitrella brassicaformis CCMP3155]